MTPLRFPLILAGGAALLVLVRAGMPLSVPENEANPWTLIAAVPPELRVAAGDQRLHHGRAADPVKGIRPYIDGRGDMYGDELVVDYARITRGDAAALDRAVQRWGIAWAIVPNRNSGLGTLLAASPDWRLLKKDRSARYMSAALRGPDICPQLCGGPDVRPPLKRRTMPMEGKGRWEGSLHRRPERSSLTQNSADGNHIE